MPYWFYIIIGLVAFLLIGGIVAGFVITNPIAKKLYNAQWVRHSSEQFPRGCSDASFDFHLDMFNQGMEWRKANLSHIKEVEIQSDGLKLVGEYFDYGFKKAVIIMAGRMETCFYGCYYAEVFVKAKYNVLCIDPRAHGLSEGKYITLGKGEGKDLIEWSKLLHDKYGINSVCLYGICGGATAGCFALTDKNRPDYINEFIADGMFYSFFEVYKRHIIDEKKPVYPIIWTIFGLIKKNNGVNPYDCAPKKLISNIKVRTLILSGEDDIFALPKKAEKLYKKCGSVEKYLVSIPNARHSHLRYFNKEVFDKAVLTFLTK